MVQDSNTASDSAWREIPYYSRVHIKMFPQLFLFYFDILKIWVEDSTAIIGTIHFQQLLNS